MIQTILGAGGAIGIPLAKELQTYCSQIRLVGRNPEKVNDTDELFEADLTQKEQVDQAVKGSEVVYLTVGLPYNLKVWERDWPIIIENVIDACLKHAAKLVFFDNVYMYAISAIPHMTETSAIDPPGKKGKIRASLIQMIFNAIQQQGLNALIARSADFYGPNVKTSILDVTVLDNLRKGKKAFWQADATKIHSFTYTLDAGRATAILGNTADAYNQVWHLPTSSEKLTGKQYIELIANEMGVVPRYYVLSKLIITLLGPFIPIMKELKEMQYQNDRDYFFDSTMFEDRFSFSPTSYEKGIKEMVASAKISV